MPQWMKRPNLASRHHFILASCFSLVSVGEAAGNAETRQAPAQMMRITSGITLCFTIAFLLPGTAIACVSFAENRRSRRLADQAQPFAFRIIPDETRALTDFRLCASLCAAANDASGR